MGDGHLDNLIGHMETPAAVTVMSEVGMAFTMKMVDKAPLMAILGAEANYLADHHEDSNLVKRSVNRLIGDCSAYQIKADRTARRVDIMIGNRDARTSNTPTLEVVMNSEQNGGYVTEVL